MSAKTIALNEPLGHVDLPAPLTVDESATYKDVLAAMRKAQRGSIIVCKSGKVTGVFTERDVLYKHILEKVSPKTPIAKLMTPKPRTVTPETTVGQAIELMHDHHIRNLPMVDKKGKPKGLLTVGTIIRYLADHFPAEVVNLPPKLDQIMSDSEGA